MSLILPVVLIMYWIVMGYFLGVWKKIREEGLEAFLKDLWDGLKHLYHNPQDAVPWVFLTVVFGVLAVPFLWIYSKLKSDEKGDSS